MRLTVRGQVAASPVHGASAGSQPSPRASSTGPLPEPQRREVVELMARALLADMRKHPDLAMAGEDAAATDVPPRGSEAQAGEGTAS